MISNIWKSTCHVSCLNSDGKTIKVDAKYAFSQALSHFKFWLAGSMCSTGIHVKPSLQAPGGILEPSSWEQRKSTKARILKLMSQGNKLNKLYQSSCAHGIAGQQRGDRKRGAEWLSQGPAGTCQEGAVVWYLARRGSFVDSFVFKSAFFRIMIQWIWPTLPKPLWKAATSIETGKSQKRWKFTVKYFGLHPAPRKNMAHKPPAEAQHFEDQSRNIRDDIDML